MPNTQVDVCLYIAMQRWMMHDGQGGKGMPSEVCAHVQACMSCDAWLPCRIKWIPSEAFA